MGPRTRITRTADDAASFNAFELLVPPLTWAALWGALNAGGLRPGVLVAGEGYAAVHALRALLPVAVLVFWGLHLGARARLNVRLPSRPEAMWIAYGFTALGAGLAGPRPAEACYWALAFLAPFLAAELYLGGNRRLHRGARLNHLTWLCTGLALLFFVIAAGERLLVGSGLGASAYGVVNRVGDVLGMPMSRSSGLSRMAAVVALVSYAAALDGRGPSKVAWALPALGGGLIVYVAGSDGSLVAAIGAILVVTWMACSAKRTVFLLGATTAGIALASATYVDPLATRLPDLQGLVTFDNGVWSGRPRIWGRALAVIRESPIFGHGFQADRFLVGQNASNGFVYALLSGGGAGAVLYLGGLALFWRRLFDLARGYVKVPDGHRRTTLQVGAVAAFLTLRHVFENTSALFSVDLLLLAPAIVYVGELARSASGR